ncbi:unnamed protein product [Alopecurus aequalis]
MSSGGILATSTRFTAGVLRGSKMEAKRRRGEQVVEAARKRSVASDGAIPLDALDCTICYNPLRPPVSQCKVGHVICSSCHDNLQNKDKCHMCAITGGYDRCIAVDKILESVLVPCSNSNYGCAMKTRYYERDYHMKSCPQEPCFCPEDDCRFTGPTTALLQHLTSNHQMTATEFEFGCRFTLQMQEGLQVVHKRKGSHLFLVKSTPVPPFGNATSILYVDPHAVVGERKFGCQVDFQCRDMGWRQYLDFQIRSTTLYDGLPTEDGSYSFIVPSVSCNPPNGSSSSIVLRFMEIIPDDAGSDWRWRLRS